MNNKKMIEQLPNLCVSLELISVYDIDAYSTAELLYMIAKKLNESIIEMNRFETVIDQKIIEQTQKIDELLTQGLEDQVVSQLVEWLHDGTLAHILTSEVIMESINRIYYDAKLSGAVGDGITDDTQAIQRAIDYCHEKGYTLSLNGDYLITDQLQLREGSKIDGHGMTNIKLGNRIWDKPAIIAHGEKLQSVTLVSGVTTNEQAITVTNTTGITSNSVHQILSQRSAFSEEAGEFYRLGTATESTEDAVLGEFIHVASLSGNQLNLYNRLIFPDYLTTAEHRECSTVEILNTINDVEIKGIRFIEGSTSKCALIELQYAVNSRIVDCHYQNTNEGHYIDLRNCYRCSVQDSSVAYLSELAYSTHYARNGFKALSSQYCEFINCHAQGGTQPFDFTYIPSSMPTVLCEIRNCFVKSATYTGMTFHPGTYACVIEDCNIESFKDGIMVRGQGHLVNGNYIHGFSNSDAYGIGCSEGYANNISVSNNYVTSFHRGIRVNESISDSRDLSYNKTLRLNISNNHLSDIRVAFFIDRAIDSTNPDLNANISIENNFISSFKFGHAGNTYFMQVEGDSTINIDNIIIKGNVCNVKPIQPTNLIRINCNASLVMQNNSFMNFDSATQVRLFYATSTRTIKITQSNNVIDSTNVVLYSGTTAGPIITNPDMKVLDTLFS